MSWPCSRWREESRTDHVFLGGQHEMQPGRAQGVQAHPERGKGQRQQGQDGQGWLQHQLLDAAGPVSQVAPLGQLQHGRQHLTQQREERLPFVLKNSTETYVHLIIT